jgi:hypothetical protein
MWNLFEMNGFSARTFCAQDGRFHKRTGKKFPGQSAHGNFCFPAGHANIFFLPFAWQMTLVQGVESLTSVDPFPKLSHL